MMTAGGDEAIRGGWELPARLATGLRGWPGYDDGSHRWRGVHERRLAQTRHAAARASRQRPFSCYPLRQFAGAFGLLVTLRVERAHAVS
jgi:hypothetical protein